MRVLGYLLLAIVLTAVMGPLGILVAILVAVVSGRPRPSA